MTLAMVFPGQGSQSMGMQAELAAADTTVKATYDDASEQLGYDLWDLVQNGPAEKLDETVVTQPAMLTAGIGAWRAWQNAGGTDPAFAAGHSLGEYTALVVAGALDFGDAIRLVRERAELMQEAVPAGHGAMAAILGLDDSAVLAVCDAAADGEVVSAVNFNSPGQIVIAGTRSAVERAAEGAKTAGAKRVLMLSVSVPSHCALMRPAADELAKTLANTKIETPVFPVVGNADVQIYASPDDIRTGLARQLYSPVRWVETVRFLLGRGAVKQIECGPGKVLTGLAKRIDRSLESGYIDSSSSLAQAISLVATP